MTSKPRSRSRFPAMKATAISRPALFAAALLLASAHAWAVQRLEVRPDATVAARIAYREVSRLKVDGAPIVEVFGSVYSADNTAGELIVSPDAAGGELYVRPAAGAIPGKPINIFVKAASGATYTLLLTPTDVPSDTIVLVERETVGMPVRASVQNAPAANWIRRIKHMMLALSREGGAPGFVGTNVGQVVGLWQEARFFEIRRLAGLGLVGSVYELTNVSDSPMVLDEREFLDDGVVAVEVAQEALAPRESTRVFIVRERE